MMLIVKERSQFIRVHPFFSSAETNKRSRKTEKVLHACPECNKVFTKRFNYERHLATHTDIKAYSCRYCSKTFNQSSNCKSHELTHVLNQKKGKPDIHDGNVLFYSVSLLHL